MSRIYGPMQKQILIIDDEKILTFPAGNSFSIISIPFAIFAPTASIQYVDSFYGDKLKKFDGAELTGWGTTMNIKSATSATFPKAVITGDLKADNLRELELPLAQIGKDINVSKAAKVYAPNMQRFISMHADCAREIYTPNCVLGQIYGLSAYKITVSDDFSQSIYCKDYTKVKGGKRAIIHRGNWIKIGDTLNMIIRKNNNDYKLQNPKTGDISYYSTDGHGNWGRGDDIKSARELLAAKVRGDNEIPFYKMNASDMSEFMTNLCRQKIESLVH